VPASFGAGNLFRLYTLWIGKTALHGLGKAHKSEDTKMVRVEVYHG